MSNNPKDLLPAKDPCPVDTLGKPKLIGGYHTNKGITWTTWKSMSKICNYIPSAKLWYEMPPGIWEKIMELGFWTIIKGSQIKSQGIADIMINWAFMSGPGTVVMKMQRFLALNQDGNIGPLTLKAVNDRSALDDTKFISEFLDYNLKFLLSLSSLSYAHAGWTNRINALRPIALHDALNSPSQLFPLK